MNNQQKINLNINQNIQQKTIKVNQHGKLTLSLYKKAKSKQNVA